MSRSNQTQRMLQVSNRPADARQALKATIPSMAGGININTAQGDISLHGEDAEAVMALVGQIAQRRSQAS